MGNMGRGLMSTRTMTIEVEKVYRTFDEFCLEHLAKPGSVRIHPDNIPDQIVGLTPGPMLLGIPISPDKRMGPNDIEWRVA